MIVPGYKLAGIPSTYQGWPVFIISDADGKIFVSQVGKVAGVSNWAFHVWMKSGIEDPTATRVCTLPDGSNGTLMVIGSALYAVEIRKGGGIALYPITQYVAPTPGPTPGPTPPDPSAVQISHDVAVQLYTEIGDQL